MVQELPKAYEPQKYEDDIYRHWEASGFFNPDNVRGEPYSIMMPPPNVTGVLHLGHALENALMDTMVRYQRMQGKKVLLLPGTDHAAVATQAKVEKMLMQEGLKNPRQELGREELVRRIRAFAEESKTTIVSQIRKMGTSCDWSRLAYTFDEARNRAVNEMFVRMYQDGLIYRGYRVVNWSVKGQSTCSDDELVHVERPAKLYTFKYSKDFPIPIASTRPETKLGDTAVAVNPNDKRYEKYIGKIFKVDVGAAQPLDIKIIADENVDPHFGTGALGVTPAHSAVDFEMYEKQKAQGDAIGLISVIGSDGRMTEAAGEAYVGLTVEEARQKFVVWLRQEGLLEKEEDIMQNVGTSDRFGDVVEALPLTQWFVNVAKEIPGRGKSLKDLMREAVAIGHHGDHAQKITILPERFEKIYFNWIEHLRDWCISRQVWWGHRIPVYYCKQQNQACGEPIVSKQNVVNCPNCGEAVEQDPDTLDTWFSSGLWTFSTLGWPEQTKDLQMFHPAAWIQMGYEIIFFWMARMILMSTYVLDQIPFHHVYIHGILRDESGKKFSKSAGNNINPLDVIAEFGTDALRWSVLSGIAPGNDSKFYEEKIEGARNLVNKLWNMARFMLLQIDSKNQGTERPEPKTLADKWILVRLNKIINSTTENLERFNFSYAGEQLRDFTWSDLADWYLEVAKIEGDKSAMLNYVLTIILKLWHPYMPFVTEALWQEIYGHDILLMVERWPSPTVLPNECEESLSQFELVKNIITGIRSLRSEYRIDPAVKLSATIVTSTDWKLWEDHESLISGLARLNHFRVMNEFIKTSTMVGFVEGGVEVYIDLGGVVDLNKETERLQKEITAIQQYTNSLEQKLANQDFIARAPEAVVKGEKKKLLESQEKIIKLRQQLQQII